MAIVGHNYDCCTTREANMTEDEREMLLEMPAVHDLLRQAVAAERDACAALIEQREQGLPDAVRRGEYLRGSLSAAIRRRGQS